MMAVKILIKDKDKGKEAIAIALKFAVVDEYLHLEAREGEEALHQTEIPVETTMKNNNNNNSSKVIRMTIKSSS